MALAVRLYHTTQTITGLPLGIPVTFHLMGGGQAGEVGQYSILFNPVGGRGGAGAWWASIVSTPAPGDVYTITIGAGGASNFGAGGDTILRKNAVIIARAPGGASASAVIGTLSNPGGAGGDPSTIANPPPGPYLQAGYGGGGGGCGGPDGRGGNGANQSDYMTPLGSPNFGYWVFNTALFPGVYSQTFNAAVNILDSFGGGGAGNGGDDAYVLTNFPQTIIAGNGGNAFFNRSPFFTVAGNGGSNRGACASQAQTTSDRTDPSIYAPGGVGQYFAALPNAGSPYPGGAVVIGIDPSLGATDFLGPGTGAGSHWGMTFPPPQNAPPFDWDLSGYDGGVCGAGGSGGSSMWDQSSNYTLVSNGGAGANGGAAAVWALPAPGPNTRIHAKVFPPIPLVDPHYILEP